MLKIIKNLFIRPSKKEMTVQELECYNNKRVSGEQILHKAFYTVIYENNLDLTVKTLKGGDKTYKRLRDYKVTPSNDVDYINTTGVFESKLRIGKNGLVKAVCFNQIRLR